jgi:outer membrane receptor protein involved in Fe transport
VIEPRQFPATFYHDLRFEFNINPRHQFYFGVDNALDTHPPFGLTGTGNATADRGGGGTAAIYDAFGRKFYAGVRARF